VNAAHGGWSGHEPSLIDWSVVERVAAFTASRTSVPPTYQATAMQADFDELTARAEELVFEATGLRAPTSRARGRVIDRPGWTRANVASFQRLLGPAMAKLAERRSATILANLPPWLSRGASSVGRSVAGAELGAVLGWMSTRVLGQYDLLLTEDASDDQDIVYYVGPNVSRLESRYGFPAREFRLWIALHEVTHRAQFTGVPWLRGYFVSLVERSIEPFVADPRRLLEAIRRAGEQIRSGRNPLAEAGMLGLVASPDQLAALQRVQALMSLLEGHGEVTMNQAGAGAVPDAARFSAVLRERRESARGAARLLQQILGIEAKFRQYAEGERFVRAVAECGGRELFDRVWQGPEWLPTLAEIRDPDAWMARVGAPPAITS